MNPGPAAPPESGQARACAGCGWLESPGATECRSCGDPMPFPGLSDGPTLAPPPAGMDPPVAPRPVATRPASSFPGRSGTLPRRPSWGAWSALIFRRRTVVAVALIAVFLQFSNRRPVSHPPGILIAEEPLQGPVPAGSGFWKAGDTNIRALASYTIKARVLHPERYRWDAMADLAPIDLGVGWGVMSDETYAARCSFSNSGRYLNWWWSGDDFPAAAATPCMTNMHMLPATERVRDRLLSLRPGQLFQAGGYLVEVTRPGMGPWTSSLSRHDTGNGACEIMWVQSLVLLP